MKDMIYRRAALRALRKMPVPGVRRIIGKMETYAADPTSLANNVKALQGTDGVRLRVGDYRVIMLDGEVIGVVKIGLRGSVY